MDRLIDKPEHQATSDTANTTKSNKRRAAERTLPLAADVVRLPTHHVRDVRVGSSTCKEDSSVLAGNTRRPAHHGESHNRHNGVSHDNGPANAVFVGHPRCGVHAHTGESVCELVSGYALLILAGYTHMVAPQGTAQLQR